jgi:hypothetical protein
MEAEEYGDALLAVEELLAEDPTHGTARFLASQCRTYLASLYSAHFADRSRVPRLQVGMGELAGRSLRLRAAFLASRIDGEASIEELIDISGMPELEVLHTLYELDAEGVVRIDEARAPAGPESRRVPEGRAASSVRRGPAPETDDATAMLAAIRAAEGRPAINRAVAIYLRSGHAIPDDDLQIQAQLLELLDETAVRAAIARLRALVPSRSQDEIASLRGRLVELMRLWEDESTAGAAERLLRDLSARIGSGAG